MHTYEIREDKNYGNVLLKDGRETFCPFQPPVPTQGMGGMGLMRLPCCTNCPHANIEVEKSTSYEITNNAIVNNEDLVEQVIYVVSCGSIEKKYEIYKSVNPHFKLV